MVVHLDGRGWLARSRYAKLYHSVMKVASRAVQRLLQQAREAAALLVLLHGYLPFPWCKQ